MRSWRSPSESLWKEPPHTVCSPPVARHIKECIISYLLWRQFKRWQAEESTRGIRWQSALSDTNKSYKKDIMLRLDPMPFTPPPTPLCLSRSVFVNWMIWNFRPTRRVHSVISRVEAAQYWPPYLYLVFSNRGSERVFCDERPHSGSTDEKRKRQRSFSVESCHRHHHCVLVCLQVWSGQSSIHTLSDVRENELIIICGEWAPQSERRPEQSVRMMN